MSILKDRAVKVSEGHWVVEGLPCPVDVFLNDTLFQASEDGAWAQIEGSSKLPGVKKIVITPDMHVGYGVPIGCVIETEGTLLPTAAGYDIGCGMCVIKTDLTANDVRSKDQRRKWMKRVEARIGVGMGHAGHQNTSTADFDTIIRQGALAFGPSRQNSERDCFEVNPEAVPLPIPLLKKDQLGSLGGGNHFVEMQVGQDNRVWVMLHTGSRGFGYKTAEHYFTRGCCAQGLSKKDEDLVAFDADGELGKLYWEHHNMAANFATANRLIIAREVIQALKSVFGGEADLYYEISHNLIQKEGDRFVHRKGATRALPTGHPFLTGTQWEGTGHPIIIPGSMEEGAALLFALAGSKESSYSINHGAGRRLGRNQARKKLDQSYVDERMASLDILVNTRQVPLDESGQCYKDLGSVLDTVESAGLAAVTERLRPVAVIKGED
jgi:tRNA-splicing ligase RtcB